jgi:hypothetical protein
MQKLFIDKWRWRIALVIAASFFGDQLSPGLGSFFAFVMILIIVIRIKKLKPVEGFKKLKSSRVAIRTKTLIDAEIVDLKERVAFYSTYKEQPVDASPDSGIVLQADEHAIAIASEVGLIESRSSGGVTEPTLVDEGRFLVTDQRGVFIGNNETREFVWSKLVSHQVEPLASAMVLYLSLSNRQKVSGIGMDAKSVKDVQQRIEFAVAVGLEREAQFLDKLKTQIAALEAEKTTAPN